MRDPQEEIRRRLDEVIGTEFDDERGKRWRLQWLRRSAPRWVAGALAGIAMAVLVWAVLDRHLKAAHEKANLGRPVVIDLVPGK